nr:unnamed protein product [Digitaria exilis]
MSFRSIEQLLRRNSKTKISRNIVDGVHEQKEEQCVQSLRELLLASNQLPEKFDDYYLLLRFLRMRGFNILKAKEMFLNMLKWREDCSVDAIANGMNNFSKSAREMFVEIQKIDSNYYPETLNQLYIINAGTGFRALWKVLKAFMEARTLAKIQAAFGKDQKSFNELTAIIACESFIGCQESSAKQVESTSRRKRTLAMLLKDDQDGTDTNGNILRKQVDEQISEKIRELEDCAAQTKETLQTLICKQQELTSHIEQLRKILR